ncbi:hypothetical protein SUGI_0789850 [Cryptomeria japonica]|uniref:uncharacterized protein LOC131028857 n=1 Tax=Cryptomeria japonica TaxID=3369 RepID=UPI0024148AF5|nr:uncharacterized protein LOC131028857 [Cryptomeria japonica]GLJ38741.1 hypothetical protein SUGI_0789850 [Cryptomeria japonica]
MGRKLDALMGKAFRSSKCKTALKLTVARIKILKNKRELQRKQSRRDVAELLQKGQEASARLRVEQIFREQNILDAYLLIGGYCETVSERILTIKAQKVCPNDLKESIASLIFAAPRCAELPELQDVRSLFAAKYGKEFAESAVELRPDCGVNKRIIEKLSTRAPSTEVKLRLMKEIASEHGIEWNFEESEVENLKPTEDILDGPRSHFQTKQMTSKPEDSIDKPAEISSISSKVPDTIRKQASGTYMSQPSPTTPKVDVTHVSTKGEEEFPSIKQVYGESANADVYNSNFLRVKKESVVSPGLATDVDSNMSEDDFYAKKRMEGKMDYSVSTENAAAYQNTPGNTHHDFVKFTKLDGLSPGSKQERIKYLDVASAAQAAFESAAYAAAAARAAVELAKGEAGNKKLNHRANDSRESMSESEDGLDEAILRKPNEVKYATSHGVGSAIEDTFSTRNDQVTYLESPRARNVGNDVFSSGSGFERIHYSKKEVPDTESVGELSEDEAAWSRGERSYVNKSNHENLNEHSDGQEEYEFNTLENDRKPNFQQMNIGGIESRFERSTSGGTSNSGEQFSSNKDARPVFDDYGDDEGDFEKNTFDFENNSERATYQSTLTPPRSLETEDTQLGYARYRSNQRQTHDSDEDDGYEKGTGRRDYKNQDSIPKTLRPIKLSHEESVPRNKYSLQFYDHESEDEMEALRDVTDVKSRGNREVPMLSSQPNASYQSPHRMPLKKTNGGTVSVDQSIYPEGTENYRNYTNSQASDDEGVYRYEGNGKLSWRPANVSEQPATVVNHKSHHVKTRMSVRTRR